MNFIRHSLACCVVTVSFLLGGCATATKSTDMVATPATPVTKHAGSLTVNVTGGNETSPMWKSMVSDTDFADAIRASIKQSGLFAMIGTGTASDYQLDIQLVRLVQPNFGASFKVTLETSWFLKSRQDQKMIWQKSVTSSHTATVGDAFVGVTRLRLATEGAVRENIKDAIVQMGALTFP